MFIISSFIDPHILGLPSGQTVTGQGKDYGTAVGYGMDYGTAIGQGKQYSGFY